MFQRNPENPIIKPNTKNDWESLKVYNPGIIYEKGIFHLWYCAVGKDWTLRIGYGHSTDGIHFKRLNNPVLEPLTPYDHKGLMDPRVTKVDNKFFMTYSADDGHARKLALATSDDLKNWTRRGLMIKNWDAIKAGAFRIENGQQFPEKPERKDRSKAGGIFSEKIEGKFWMIFGNSHLWLANSDDGINWNAVLNPFLSPKEGDNFDNLSVQGGPPPIKTDKCWLYFYHGRSKGNGDYRLGFLLLDLDDPKKILYRSSKPVFEPTQLYETTGIVDILEGGFEKMKSLSDKELRKFIKQSEEDGKMPKVIFCCGAVLVDDTIRIYYGAGDTVIGTATAPLQDFLSVL